MNIFMHRVRILWTGCLFIGLAGCAVWAQAAPPTDAPPAGDDLGFRISAIIDDGDRSWLGVIDKASKDNYFLHVGQSTPNGLKLTAIDYDRETAQFMKDGQLYVAKLKEDAALRLATAEEAKALAQRDEAAQKPRISPTGAPGDAPPFKPVVIRGDRGDLKVNALPGNSALVQLESGNKRYAMSRRIAENVLTISNYNGDAQIDMLMSFPVRVEIEPGEDPQVRLDRYEQQIVASVPTNIPDTSNLPPPPTTLPPGYKPSAPGDAPSM